MTPRRVVVVGGSIAALTAIETLRSEEFDGDITLISDEDVPPYTRVPLSKGVLAGRQPLHDIVLAPLGHDVDTRLNTTALALGAVDGVVQTTSGAVPYDGLVIATGARARRIGDGRQQEFAIRQHGDCTRLRARLESARSVIVVGGGFLGMEVASTCRDLGIDVTVVDVSPPLDRLLGRVVAAHVRTAAHAAGVEFLVVPDGVRLVGSPTPRGVRDSDGHVWSADVVVSAVGDVPNVDWLAGSGVQAERGVVVDARCSVGPGITAAGDVAVVRDRDGFHRRTPTWTNAVEQGRAAALTLLHGEDAPPARASQYCWTEQFGLDVKLVGALQPAGTPTCLDGDLASGSALLAWSSVETATTVVALNHHTPPAKLKRLVRHATTSER